MKKNNSIPYQNILLTCLVFTMFSCQIELSEENQNQPGNEELLTQDTNMIPEVSLSEKLKPLNSEFDQIGRFLAGLPQQDSNLFSSLSENKVWEAHSKQMEEIWDKAKKKRLNAIGNWEDTTFSKKINDSLPLYYPFSGPDFLHANYFYPNASSYHLVAMEPIKEFPDFQNLSQLEIKKYLSSIRVAMRDVIGKSYFITMHMQDDLRDENNLGVLPLLSVFAIKTGHSILNIKNIKIDSVGELIEHTQKSYALEISITKNGYTSKNITYMQYDLSNKKLMKDSVFSNWVSSIGQKNVFLKAASYLPHYSSFSKARSTILNNTQSIFQDDAGLAIKFVDTTIFSIQLFGDYTKPIKDFADHTFQEGLNKMYARTPKNMRASLPFSLGYHIVADKIQNHQLLISKSN